MNSKRPAILKNKIMVEWLALDPDQLAADIREDFYESDGGFRPYVSWKAIEDYAAIHGNLAYEAFSGYKGAHTTDRFGYAYAVDWQEFLYSLRKARAIAAEPGWEAPENGVVYHCLA